MNRRFWVCLFLAIPVFAIGMSDLIPDSRCSIASADRR